MFIFKLLGRFLAFIGFLVLLPIFIMGIFAIFHVKPGVKIPAEVILTLDLSDPIAETSQQGIQQFITGRTLSLWDVTSALSAAAKDSHVKGVLVRADHVSLGLAQLQELREAIFRFRKSGKKAILHVDTFGELSSGLLPFYLATAFDEISMQPGGYLNITGIRMEFPFAAEALKEIGVKAQIGTREEYKTAFSFLTDKEMSAANAEEMKGLLKSIFSEILQEITTERELTEEFVLKMMEDTPILTAEKAVELNFIDRCLSIDMLERVFKAQVGGNAQTFSLSKYLEYLKRTEQESSDSDVIALIYGVGTIQRGRTAQSLLEEEMLTGDQMRHAFEEAIKDPKVRAIVFRISSPGGSAVASDSILRSVLRARNEHKLPVIASMGNYAASGGYWIASGCTKIVSQPLTITGSIGVLGGKVVFGDALEKLKINLGAVSEGPNGSLWSFTQGYSEHQWQILQKNLDVIYDRFLQIVSQGRKLPLEHVKQIAKGRVWTGIEAKRYGLVDELGGIEKAIEVAKVHAKIPSEQAVKVMPYPKPKSFFARLQDVYEGDFPYESNVLMNLYHIVMRTIHLLKVELYRLPALAPLPEKIE
jgi:protease-4